MRDTHPLAGEKELPRQRCNRGFSLMELLVVVAIIAVLASLMVPTIENVRKVGRTVKDASNLRTMATANLAFAQDNDGRCVVAYTPIPYTPGRLYPSRNWYSDLRPYIGKNETRTNYAEVLVSPCDPTRGGLTGSNPVAAEDWRRRSYSPNKRTEEYIGSSMYQGRKLLALPMTQMIFLINHRAMEAGTNMVDPDNVNSTEMIPRDWHGPKNHVQVVFLDGHVELILVDDLLPPEGKRYADWGPLSGQ